MSPILSGVTLCPVNLTAMSQSLEEQKQEQEQDVEQEQEQDDTNFWTSSPQLKPEWWRVVTPPTARAQ